MFPGTPRPLSGSMICWNDSQDSAKPLDSRLCFITVKRWGFPDGAAAAAAKSLQSCPTLCDPINWSPPGSPVPGILQVRILEWVAGPFSRGIFLAKESNLHLLCLLHWKEGSLPLTSTIWRRRQWHPTPVHLSGKSHGWRSLVGCSPWGH